MPRDVFFRFGGTTRGMSAAARRARRELKSINSSAQETSAKFRGMWAVVTGAVGGLATSKIVNVTREFERLRAQLVTATGSAQNAEIAFKALQDFASQTPYDLQQVTEGFTKLVNLGLTPSSRALRSYGDTASAMGKDLNQLIEAVADAATGEFERLKEFGIRASSQGDQVALTFRGVTTTVQKEAAAIENYLIQLGENNFAGAMAQRMDTLDGALSNLADSWDLLFNAISEQGAGDLIHDGVLLAISAVEELTAMIASGQLQAEIVAVGGKFRAWGDDVADSLLAIDRMMSESAGRVGEQGSFFASAFSDLPENVRAVTQIAGVEIGAFVDKVVAAGDLVADALNPFDDVSAADAYSAFEARVQSINQARMDSADVILAERQAALDSFQAQVRAADDLRAKFDEIQQAKAGGGADPLQAFGLGQDPANDSGADSTEEDEARIEKLLKRYETEQELEAEHLQAMADIKQAFADGDIATKEEHDQIMLQLEADYDKKLLGLRKRTLTELQQFNQSSFQQQAKTVFGELASITAGVARENKAMFEINKVAGIANAVISAHEGISRTLGAYPFPINVGLAATHAAAAFAQVNAIRSQSFGAGGGAAPSLAGGTAAAPVTPVGGQAVGGGGGGGQTLVNLSLSGDTFSREQVEGLFQQFAELAKDGGIIPALGDAA